MTLRTQSLRQMVFDAPYNICIERAKYWTESYKETEGQHPTIRAARAIEKTLDNMSIFILNEELIVGHRTSKLLGVVLPVERGEVTTIVPMQLKILKIRKRKPFQISEEDENLLLNEIFPYWEGKTVADKKIEMFEKTGFLKKRLKRGKSGKVDPVKKFLASNAPTTASTVLDDQGHLVAGHNNIVKWGLNGIREKAMKKLDEVNQYLNSNSIQPKENNLYLQDHYDYASLESNFQDRFRKNNGYTLDNKAFLEAVIICCDAFSRFIKRYAVLADNEARNITSTKRAVELGQISEICNWISENTPRNFREALQLVWFNEIVGNISHGLGTILAVGRPDQYLFPYYKSDIESDVITDKKVLELLEEFIIKLSANLMLHPTVSNYAAPELGADHVALCVGGVDKDGKDAVNELSYLFMDAAENVKCMTVSFSIRISPDLSPKKWIQRAADIYMKTSGPAIYNDNTIIPALLKAGVALEDARDYGIVGCIEPAPQGNAFPITAGNAISLTALLEMLLNNGSRKLGGKIDGPEFDSRKFKSYEELWETYSKLIKFKVAENVKCSNIKDIAHAENYPNPIISMSIDGCIDNALDMTQGGAKYNLNTISTSGFATVVDSLAALKKLVFEDKEVSMEEMIGIVRSNFKDNEPFRLKILNKVPKFGNDNDYVDSIARDLNDLYCNEILSHSTIRVPGKYRPSIFSAGTHVAAGRFLGATPDGRLSGEAISNSLSPTNGTEKNGPTAVFNSITKLDNTKIASGMSLNMRLLPSLLKSRDERERLADLILTYLQKGGMHVQFNVVSQENLLDAQIHPENYRDLVIRVSGYCAYFVNIGKSLQNDIIARFQFENM